MDTSIIKTLSVVLLLIGGFAYAGWLVYLETRLHALELRLDALEEEALLLAQKVAENVKGYRKEIENLRTLIASHDDALRNANKQLLRRLNALTDVVDEIRNGTFTMQWEKKEVQDER